MIVASTSWMSSEDDTARPTSPVGTGETGRVRDDRREHLVDVQRGRHSAANLSKGLEFPDSILQLLEEAGILDGDGGLVGKRLQERDLTRRIRAHSVPNHRKT